MARPDAEDEAHEGKSVGEGLRDVPRMMCSEGGSEALEPRPWDQDVRAQVSWSLWSLQTSYSSEFEAVEHHGREDAAGAAMHHGLHVRKSITSENPRSGSGPSESARPEGEQTVEGAKNPEDGWCRAMEGPGHTDPSADVAEGALASTHRLKRRRHVEDGSLASLKTEPKQINADYQDLALAA
jgi:hypothetical protein